MSQRRFIYQLINPASLCQILALSSLIFLPNCSNSRSVIDVPITDGFQQNYGPFDSNGNYVENWADKAPRRRYVPASTILGKSNKPVLVSRPYTPPPSANSSKPTSTNHSTASRSSSSTRQTRTSSSSKPSTRHTVKRGDTLYGLARKYGTSVSKIQRANSLRGSTIRIGQRLTIPR